MNEEEFIKSLILKFPHKNNQVLLPENLEKLIDECIYFQDEPPASLSVVAQYILYKLANYNKEKVILSGQGADEIFGGYPRFFAFIPRFTLLYYFRNAWALFKSLIKKKGPVGESIFTYDSKKKNSFRTSSDYSKYLITKHGLRDLLHYEDRNSMANSIESRLPYMDFRLVEGMINSKNSFKFQLAKLKGALYNSFKTDLPKLIFNRINKIAFDTPEKELLKENFFNPKEELEKLKASFPDLPWNSKFKSESLNEFTAWQLYFLNKFIDSHA
jgi:asparagine synthase (glutamine-hydrolysing)